MVRTARDMATALIVFAIESGFTKFGMTPSGGGNPPSMAPWTGVDIKLLVVISENTVLGVHGYGQILGDVERERHLGRESSAAWRIQNAKEQSPNMRNYFDTVVVAVCYMYEESIGHNIEHGRQACIRWSKPATRHKAKA